MAGPLPAASFPLPPPLGGLQLVDPRTGRLTPLGLSFLTQLWAGIQGGGGTVDQIDTIFGMNGDATLSSAGVITVTASEGRAFVASAFTDTTDAGNITSGFLAAARIQDGSLPYGKIQNETDGTLLGRSAGADGAPMEISVGAGLGLSGGVLLATGGAGAFAVIGSVVTAASQTSVDFTGIPAVYEDLILCINGRSQYGGATTDDMILNFNGDTGTNYLREWMQASNSSLSATGSNTDPYVRVGPMPSATATANYAGNTEVMIGSYANTTFFKTGASRAAFFTNNATWFTRVTAFSWLNTAAINQVTLQTANGAAFVDGTRVTLYGRG